MNLLAQSEKLGPTVHTIDMISEMIFVAWWKDKLYEET